MEGDIPVQSNANFNGNMLVFPVTVQGKLLSYMQTDVRKRTNRFFFPASFNPRAMKVVKKLHCTGIVQDNQLASYRTAFVLFRPSWIWFSKSKLNAVWCRISISCARVNELTSKNTSETANNVLLFGTKLHEKQNKKDENSRVLKSNNGT